MYDPKDMTEIHDLTGLKEFGSSMDRSKGTDSELNPAPFWNPRVLATLLIVCSVGLAGAPPPSLAASAGQVALEEAIVKLETAETRNDAVQGLADLFEAAGKKTLLARSQYKYRIINAINNKHVKLNSEWDNVLSYESGELKRRVDPLRTVDLSGYLKVAPLLGFGLYLGALFIQQAIPELFAIAYPAAVFVLVLPAAFLVITT
jgi:hypothetical protein